MSKGEVILSFDEVSFEFGHNKPILDEVSFSVRKGMKVTLMGQNGAGKSTLFSMITGASKIESGKINKVNGITIAQAKQVISRDLLDLTVREFFEKCFKEKVYDIDVKIDEVLEVALAKKIKGFGETKTERGSNRTTTKRRTGGAAAAAAAKLGNR